MYRNTYARISNDIGKGDTLKIPCGRSHRVMGLKGEVCRFLIIQGVGEYDFVPE